MIKMDWHKAKPTTFEYLRERYSYGDLVFRGLALNGPLDGVLHIEGFMPKPGTRAELFVLFKDIRKIAHQGEVTHPVFTYEVEMINAEQSIKKLTLQFDGGSTEIQYKDELLCLCQLPNGEPVAI